MGQVSQVGNFPGLLTCVKTIHNSAYGVVFDCFYTCEISLDFSITIFEVIGLPHSRTELLHESEIAEV